MFCYKCSCVMCNVTLGDTLFPAGNKMELIPILFFYCFNYHSQLNFLFGSPTKTSCFVTTREWQLGSVGTGNTGGGGQMITVSPSSANRSAKLGPSLPSLSSLTGVHRILGLSCKKLCVSIFRGGFCIISSKIIWIWSVHRGLLLSI